MEKVTVVFPNFKKAIDFQFDQERDYRLKYAKVSSRLGVMEHGKYSVNLTYGQRKK